MTEIPDDFANWKHLLYVADTISELPADPSSYEEIRRLLNSLDEHFPRSLNPLEDFRAYAVRQFCKSLAQSLQSLHESKPSPGLFRWIKREQKK